MHTFLEERGRSALWKVSSLSKWHLHLSKIEQNDFVIGQITFQNFNLATQK